MYCSCLGPAFVATKEAFTSTVVVATKEAFTSTVVVAVCVSVDTSVSPRVPVALLYLPGSHW